MADFTQAQIGVQPVGTMGGGGQRPAPVQQPSAAAAALNLFAQVMPTGEQLQERRRAEEERVKAGLLESFQQDQLALAEAVDAGAISSREARMRMRANYSQAISDNPMLADDYQNAHSNIMGTSGLGKVAAEGTEQEQAFFAAQREATLAGFVTPHMDHEQAFEATQAYMRIKQRSALFDAEKKAIDFQRAQVGLQTDHIRQGTARLTQENTAINLQLNREKLYAQHYAGATADDYMGVLVTQADTLRALVESGEMEAVEAAEIFRENHRRVTAEVRRAARGAGSDFINNVLAPIDDEANATIGYLTGEINAEVYNSLTENNISRQSYLVSGDENMSFLIGTSRMAGQGGALALEAPMQAGVVNYMQHNMRPTGKTADLFPSISGDGTIDASEAQGVEQYLRIVRNSLGHLIQGTATGDVEGLSQEVNTNLNNILRGFEQHETVIENPRQIREVVEFIKHDSFGTYAEQFGIELDRQALAGAQRVFNIYYDEEIRPLIIERWQRARTEFSPAGHRLGGGLTQPDPEGPPVAEVFQPVFTGKGIEFQLTDDSLRNNPRVQSTLRDLNREVAGPVNDLIITTSHLNQTRDYEKIYNERYARLFEVAPQGE